LDSGLASSSRHYEIPKSLVGVLPAIMLQPQPGTSYTGRGATVLPIENDRFIATVTGPKACPPPVSESGFLDYAQSVGHRIVADLLSASVPLEPVRAYRNLSNRRRYLEDVALPCGFLTIGDALVAVEPTNSHGMANAALGACRLWQDAARSGLSSKLQKGVAEAAETGWQIATNLGSHNERGSRGAHLDPTPLEHRLSELMASAMLRSPELARDFFNTHMLTVQHTTNDLVGNLQAAMKLGLAPLTADEAVGQYSALAEWWLQLRMKASGLGSDEALKQGEESFATR
jgi:hypothetical protein